MSDSLPFPPSYDKILEYFKRHPLLNAMLACLEWYNIIQTTPTFWTEVGLGVEAAIKAESDEESGTATVASSEQLNRALKKSGTLPLHAIILPPFVGDFRAVRQALGTCTDRLELLSLVVPGSVWWDTERGMGATDLQDLLQQPLPRLKQLHIQAGLFGGNTSWSEDKLPLELDTPNLDEISAHRHLILPRTPSSLLCLSLFDVHLAQIQPPIELHGLLELRLTRCDLRILLPTFFTPSLRILVIQDSETPAGAFDNVPIYHNLQELQWSDKGPDRNFEAMLLHCPNITIYSNYTRVEEAELDVRGITVGPTILTERSTIPWPKVEEVRFDAASCDDIQKALEIMPTIKRLRVLRDPIERLALEPENQRREEGLLAKLREKVEIII
ncbi:hypothetical protein M407DRAFT_29368 [Tulasnella calospora MUT 4182]|uniref:F-box domain-containing protein n=1 Tax=Tulasnella calospora MUT 4182 TaxID=1051891 RepID=A0A0C3Q911_9AGAM|nr:hypothetical protein M407DRAFT_29368 [Tulasnella calospora MUT 4182]